jgi:hypothetical protein
MDTVQERLYALYKKHKGLTPDLVVADAKREDSPLHEHFNWDVEQAAEAYWREQARTLIRSVRFEVQVESTHVACVAYVRDPNAPVGEQGYLHVSQVRTEKDVARAVLREEFSRAGAALTRARELASVFGLKREVESLMERVDKARKKLEPVKAA